MLDLNTKEIIREFYARARVVCLTPSQRKDVEEAAHMLLGELKAEAVFFANPWIASMLASGVLIANLFTSLSFFSTSPLSLLNRS